MVVERMNKISPTTYFSVCNFEDRIIAGAYCDVDDLLMGDGYDGRDVILIDLSVT